MFQIHLLLNLLSTNDYCNMISSMSKRINIQGAVGMLDAVLQKPLLENGQKCPLVILMHGLMMRKEFVLLKKMAEKLQMIGIATIRFDFNGHGQSQGEFQDMTVPTEIEDARKVYHYASSLDFVSNVSFMGHSQGGVVASMLAGQLEANNIKCLVLMAPAAVFKDQAIEGNTLGTKFDPKNIPDFVTAYGRKIGRMYLKTAQVLPIFEIAAHYTGPVCIIQGKKDDLVPYHYSEKYSRIYQNSELHLLDNEVHLFGYDMDLAINIAVGFFDKILLKGAHCSI